MTSMERDPFLAWIFCRHFEETCLALFFFSMRKSILPSYLPTYLLGWGPTWPRWFGGLVGWKGGGEETHENRLRFFQDKSSHVGINKYSNNKLGKIVREGTYSLGFACSMLGRSKTKILPKWWWMIVMNPMGSQSAKTSPSTNGCFQK